MTRSLLINNEERWQDVLFNQDVSTFSTEYSNVFGGGACSFLLNGDQPGYGQTVEFEDTVDLIYFYGFITKIDPSEKPDRTVWQITCQDCSFDLNRRKVVEIYENKTAAYIVTDIMSKYKSNYTVECDTGSGTIDKIVFDYVNVTDALKKVADYVGWYLMFINNGRGIRFIDLANYSYTAPFEITEGQPYWGLKPSIDISNLRNRVVVKGGKMESDTNSHEFKADGSARAWTLPFIYSEISAMTIAGTAVTFGEEQVVEESTVDYRFNYKEKKLTASGHVDTLAEGNVFHIEGKYLMDVLVQYDDQTSQISMATILGETGLDAGVYEHTITDTNLTSVASAEAAAELDLSENSNPKVTGTVNTKSGFWDINQLVHVEDKGLDNDYLIIKVKKSPIPMAKGGGWINTITFGGRLYGIADVLKTLVNNQVASVQSTNTAILKALKAVEIISMDDQWTLTYRATPWAVEESVEGVVATQ